MDIKNSGILLLFTFFSFVATGQNVFSSLNLSESKGDKLFNNFSFKQAVEVYSQVLEKNPSNSGIKLKIAESYRLLNDNVNAEKWYAQVITDNSIIKPEHKLHYAQVLSGNTKYDSAKTWFLAYQQDNSSDTRSANSIASIDNISSYFIDSSRFDVQNVSFNSSESDFSPAWYKEGLVFVSNRESNKAIKRVFNMDDSNFLDLYYTEENEDGTHLAPVLFHKNINTKLHEGPSIYFDDYNEVIFTGNNSEESEDGTTKLSLYQSSSVDGINWASPKSINLNNKEYSVGHPALSEDYKTLYFSSNMPGGKGGVDLYKSDWANGQWADPVNLTQVNTEGNEMFPFILAGSILYYSSNGLGGLGGLDLYKIDLNGDSGPSNLGSPLNSNRDDFGIIVNQDGYSGYFSSNRSGGIGDDDIYFFSELQLNINYQIVDAITSQGINNALIITEEGENRLPDLRSDADGQTVATLKPGKNYIVKVIKPGFYPAQILMPAEELDQVTGFDIPLNRIPPGTDSELDSLISLYSQGHISGIENSIFEQGQTYKVTQEKVSLVTPLNQTVGDDSVGTENNPPEKVIVYAIGNIPGSGQLFFKLDSKFFYFADSTFIANGATEQTLPIKVTDANYRSVLDQYLRTRNFSAAYFSIQDILFDFNKDLIRTDASIHLDSLLILLEEHPELSVELSGHTDSRGPAAYNEKLSKKRVESANAYLVNKGVNPNRIQDKYFGEKRLVNGCDDAAKCLEPMHQQNRRVEIRILFE